VVFEDEFAAVFLDDAAAMARPRPVP